MTEAEELELLELENENAAASAPQKPQQGSAVQRLLQFAKEQGPAAIGSATGAALGAPAGPFGAAGGAMLGGAGARGLQRTWEYLSGGRDPVEDTASQNAREIGMVGLMEGAGEGGLAALRLLKPAGAKLGAGLAKVAANVPEKYSLAAFKDPSILSRAESAADVGRAYEEFERRRGLESLQAMVERVYGQASPPTAKLERLAIGTKQALESGAMVSPQQMYYATQAGAKLKQMAGFGEPKAAMAAASRSVQRAKELASGALERQYPDYGPLPTRYFESRAKKELSRLLPANKGGTTNVLRPALGLREALIRGTLGATTGLAALSPAAWGLLIRALPALGKGGAAATRLGAAAAADELSREEELP